MKNHKNIIIAITALTLCFMLGGYLLASDLTDDLTDITAISIINVPEDANGNFFYFRIYKTGKNNLKTIIASRSIPLYTSPKETKSLFKNLEKDICFIEGFIDMNGNTVKNTNNPDAFKYDTGDKIIENFQIDTTSINDIKIPFENFITIE